MQVDICERNSQLEPRVMWSVNGKPFYGTDAAKCFDELKYSTARTSVYANGEASFDGVPARLASPEHLAPVFLMWPRRRFNVDACAEGAAPCSAELPMLDGSALPFFHAVRKQAGTPEELVFYDAPVTDSWEWSTGAVRIYPSETFEVEYVLGFGSAASVAVYSAEDLYNIFEARTFIFESEYEKARQAGLLAGVDETCGLLLKDGDAALNATKYRVAEEPAFHKILDLLGDLTFVKPALPKIHIEILNGGHFHHHKIMEKVLPYAIRCRICP